ncbi:MAG: family 10 glycosylhydrolase [Phycisphaerae bacterium]|nr:family 10 glycosylhydrolase [Phycisphaerae bacterium]
MHYRHETDIETIMRNCAALGINTVLWQVRGEGTVAYRSAFEPWSATFDFRDPGFDPLAIAVREAHANGLRIEAWINVMPGWRGQKPPPIRTQLYYTHPEWFLYDADGRRQPPDDFYAILNPCLPEVRQYLVDICAEIATNYDVDGLHLDYVRYAWDTTPGARGRYPRDERTLSLYERETGLRPDADRAAWDRWRAAQVTRLVRQIRTMLGERRPDATLTAAVGRDPHRAFAEHLQDGATWLRLGLIDAAMPMAYTQDAAAFGKDIEAYRAAAAGGRVIPGIGLYRLDEAPALRAQLERCRAWGGELALFSYESLHAVDGDRGTPPTTDVQRSRQMRRAVVGEALSTMP